MTEGQQTVVILLFVLAFLLATIFGVSVVVVEWSTASVTAPMFTGKSMVAGVVLSFLNGLGMMFLFMRFTDPDEEEEDGSAITSLHGKMPSIGSYWLLVDGKNIRVKSTTVATTPESSVIHYTGMISGSCPLSAWEGFVKRRMTRSESKICSTCGRVTEGLAHTPGEWH